MVASQRADVTMLEAGDIYRAGKGWGLIPIMSEVQKFSSESVELLKVETIFRLNFKVYNLGTDDMTGIPYYYSVAVVKIRDNSSELIYLKRRNSCHTGLGQAAGWIIPM